MKVLMISGDAHLLDATGGAGERLELQRSVVHRLDVVVWPHVHGSLAVFSRAVTGSYDVITAQDPFWRGLFAWKLSLFTGASLNVQVHADLRSARGLRAIIARFVLRRAKTIRVVSESITEAARHMGVRGRISVLPIYVPIERFRAVVREPSDSPIILWIGRLEKEKDPLDAIRIFKALHARGSTAEMVMLGDGALRSRVQEESAGSRVRLLGWQDPVPYLSKATVVLSTSPYESWGASIVEALAAGVPVVSYDVGIAREAGARIATRETIVGVLEETLSTQPRGELKISVLGANDWANAWRATLV